MFFDRFDLDEDLKIKKLRILVNERIEQEDGEAAWVCVDLFESTPERVVEFFNDNRKNWRDRNCLVSVEVMPSSPRE